MRKALAMAAILGLLPWTLRAAGAAGQAAAPLHVPSPDWREQVIYFVMTDRFDDGDPANNDQHADEYDPTDNAKYSGGDLAGVQRRLDYIQQLGATAVWITPPVANQWWNTRIRYGGYHGYWGEDFSRVDAHLGTLADYQRLSRGLHGRGMYLVQDIVVNHTADYFSWPHGWNADDPVAGFTLTPDSRGHTAPTRVPFSHNDLRDPAQRAEAIYHWTPAIVDYNDPRQVLDYQLADLDDLNTENPVVRTVLRRAYGSWIRDAGVDAFRLDTAFHVSPEYLQDFMRADDATAPGIERIATATGRKDFLVFGEGFGIDLPYQDVQARRIDAYMRDAAGKPVLPSMINFPLYGTLLDVFARGRPSAELGYRIRNMMAVHADPWRMPSFVDNHDVDRFLTGGSEAGLRQALLAIMTLPGIPVIYYGTEQGVREQRAAMFAGGFGSGGHDHFDVNAPLYRYLKRAIALRRGYRVFTHGMPTVLSENTASAGVVVWRMRDGAQSALVAFNTADHAALLDNLDTGLEAGTVLKPAFPIEGEVPALIVGEGGRVSARMPARAGWVWMPGASVAMAREASATIMLSPLAQEVFDGDVVVHGRASGVGAIRLVVDGDLTHAQSVTVCDDGGWHATLDTSAMLDADAVHRVVAWLPEQGVASQALTFRVARSWQVLVERDDPLGDDHGRNGHYQYPLDPGWSQHYPADIEHVRIASAAGALKVEVRLRRLQAGWNPPNGFDHVALTLFLQLPGRAGGSTIMPLQHGDLPDGMRWHYRLRVNGWSNALFSAQRANAEAEGEAVSPAANLLADRDRRTITLLLPARALGNPVSLSGAKLYLNTWDYDGGYRALKPQADTHNFGGGDGSRDALVMDETDVIVLP